MQLSRAAVAVASVIVTSRVATADTITLDLSSAIERGHRVSLAVVGARGEIREAEAGVVGAAISFTSNPEIELGGGPRFTTPRKLDLDARIAQDLDLGRRAPRRALASAEVVRARASADANTREVDLEVAEAFYATLHADRAIELAKRAEDLATRAAEAANRRRRAGDITDLDANLAHAAAGRAHSATQAAASERAATAGRLAILVGANSSDTIAATGELRATAEPASAGIGTRADLRELDAARHVGEMESDVARANASTALGVWVGYAREDANTVLLAGVHVTLPTWNRGQGEIARANAHVATAREELTIAIRIATREVADARTAFIHAREAVETYEHDVIPALDAAEQLLDKNIAAGQLAVGEYLIARQELVSGRREYIDRLLALAKTNAILHVAAGVSP